MGCDSRYHRGHGNPGMRIRVHGRSHRLGDGRQLEADRVDKPRSAGLLAAGKVDRLEKRLGYPQVYHRGSQHTPPNSLHVNPGYGKMLSMDGNTKTKRHRWDYGGSTPYAARRKTCRHCGITGTTFGCGAGRYWTYKMKNGTILPGSRQPACPPGQTS